MGDAASSKIHYRLQLFFEGGTKWQRIEDSLLRGPV